MAVFSLIYALTFCFLYNPSLITAQQSYASTNCAKSSNTSSVLGYNCNGVNKTCQSYLIFRTTPSYNTVSSIAALMSVSGSRISAMNQNITQNFTMATNTEVIIPVTCSCTGKYYQTNTTYLVHTGDNYYLISNDTFGGLTTCNAIRSQKVSPNVADIFTNEKLTIPLRCACPTRKQVNEGVRYLMSFVIQPGNDISSIAIKFGADVGQTLEANEKSVQDSVIQPFTTLLLPLQSPPNSSVMEYPPLILSPSPSPSPLSSTNSSEPMSGSPSSGNKKWTYFGVGAVAGGLFVLVVGMALVLGMSRGRRRERNDLVASSESFEAREKGHVMKSEMESLEFLKSISGIASLKVYSFKELQGGTEDFSSDHWIKGSVYKGVLDGNQVAIKKINGDVSREISVLNKIHHFNLVSLLGVCFNDGVWYLVYEYALNGPLSDWIYEDGANGKTLSWGKRMQVGLDVATGLNYLHSYTSPPLVHKDIKSANILLDGDFRAKIAKFALSRPVSGNDGQFTLTKHIVGTQGYLAPEYLENGLVSPMLDVYSFGILLLEMITGKNVGLLYEGVKVHLSEVLTPLITGEERNAKLIEFVDDSLGEDYPTDVAMSMVMLVDHCLRKDPGNRPSMDEIVRILSKTLTTSLIWGSSSASTTSTSKTN
ncbi:lysM domain receptor-like kinase 4 [Silene latifolia]|uniref:lysM domain receptor-like kinase 4 n=1 Tax=Silene latifolia TaxID=37657 RepID=UPI003D77AF35